MIGGRLRVQLVSGIRILKRLLMNPCVRKVPGATTPAIVFLLTGDFMIQAALLNPVKGLRSE